jgi:hypothetical protein
VDTAVLDACVLFRGGVRDFLLWVAEAGAFSPAWSDTIHKEWMSSRRDKFGDPMSRLNYAREEMEKTFPGANFDPDPEALKAILLPMSLQLPSPRMPTALSLTTCDISPIGFSVRLGSALKLRTSSAPAFSMKLQ